MLRSCLGFSASNGYAIRAQETKGKMRPDLVVLKVDKPILVIEVKKLDFNLDKAQFRSGKSQLKEYLNAFDGVHWGILSNGFEWRLYDFSNNSLGGVEIHSFDLRNDNDQLDMSKRAVQELGWAFVELHENHFSSGSWKELSREANAFSPDSLARAMLSTDVVRYIGKFIRGEHDFKANMDVLFDKIAAVLEYGLNDADANWNDAKRAELQKYLKSQKRASRKKKKIRSDGSSSIEESKADEPNVESVVIQDEQGKKVA